VGTVCFCLGPAAGSRRRRLSALLRRPRGGAPRSRSSSARARSCAWATARWAEDIEAVSTGSLGLDIALGIGGLPRGRVVEIYGPESSGKTTLTLQVIAEARSSAAPRLHRRRARARPGYAEKLGVNVDDLLVSQPDTGEQALEIADMLVRSGASTWS
jgi:protein RecA